MTLQTDSTLQGGKYRILSVLGQGGFGITYLAEQTMLGRKVAIKEFFMKGLCDRDESTSHVTLGTAASRDTVIRFREKFLKEARNIAKLNHSNIVRIFDVFEENGTAYYVMDYIGGKSLLGKVKSEGPLTEETATSYILQVADALEYIHSHKMNHLDVKPANVVLNDETGAAVLIDFGLSKQYDSTGEQTSTTPVGISDGYAPMEQYKSGGVGTFSPQTDIYSLGATFFYLLTGQTPPSASDVNEDGVPVEQLRAKGVSQKVIDIICKAMKSSRKYRIANVHSFKEMLQTSSFVKGVYSDANQVVDSVTPQRKSATPIKPQPSDTMMSKSKSLFNIVCIAALIMIWLVILVIWGIKSSTEGTVEDFTNTSTTSAKLYNNVLAFNGINYRFVRVKGGTFTMGATSEQGSYAESREMPAHQVTLSTYSIGETEVTQELWKAVMGNNPSKFKGAKRPVEQVTWNDCQVFIKKLNEATGENFRLPTEAEWEYAARGGHWSKGYKYSGSNNLGEVAWYGDNSGNMTHDVATKQSNELGLYDMSGNVCEWCQDWYEDYSDADQMNPKGADSGDYRVNRGGSWILAPMGCRSSCRFQNAPSYHPSGLGMRLAISD